MPKNKPFPYGSKSPHGLAWSKLQPQSLQLHSMIHLKSKASPQKQSLGFQELLLTSILC